jgi:hypothetical protein
MIPRNRAFCLALTLAAVVTGCGDRNVRQSNLQFRMGEPLLVRPFTYTILETRWRPQLGELFSLQVPQNQFLLIRVSITNSGGQPAAAPLLSLTDSSGNTFSEHQNGNGVDNWMGLIRNVKPAETEVGWIVFDVPPNNYTLRCYGEVTDDAEQVGLVRIPLNLESMNENPNLDIPGMPAPDRR